MDSPFSKLVLHVPGTVLGWFQRAWGHEDPKALLEAEFGGGPYGFDSIFEAIRDHHLPRPETLGQLHELLDEHLWIESDEPLRLDERGLRVRTDDDEADVLYYLLEDEAVAAHPERVAYLLNDVWPLPSDTAAASGQVFTPNVPLRIGGKPGPGPDAVYVVRIGWQHSHLDGTNFDPQPMTVFPGVDLPGITGHLRTLTEPPVWENFNGDLLRALTGPGDDGIGPAIDRYVRLTSYDLVVPGGTAPNHEQILGWMQPDPPAEARVAVDEHLVQAARYIDTFWGHEQLFVFDTRWAASHPDLALSLLRCATHWDPFEPFGDQLPIQGVHGSSRE
ncbi:hypothetical protein [Actinoplanes philippinensis]|uniref:hypothetical protein n=1 Tax=Actinoplanes philippinensis TaxID=35752 RepID=UPI0033DDA6CA